MLADGTSTPASTTTTATSTDTPAPTQATSTSASATQAPVATDTPVPATTAAPTNATQASTTTTDTPAPATTVAPATTTDTPVPATTAAPTDVTPSATSTATATATATALAQVPSGTQVVAMDGTGNVQPLATQAAADIIATGDPIWCPTGQTPGGAGCTPAETTVAQLITQLNGKTGDGTIYFTSTYSTNDATFNHNSTNLSGLGALTIQGGWNGSTGVSFNLSGVSAFSVPLVITNWKNDVTVNDITISNAATTGLTVNTTGHIRVHHVTSSNNTGSGRGAVLNNSSGTGSISVDNSNFNSNSTYGLLAYSNGDITLTNVIADSNQNGSGAYLKNNYSGATGSISVDNSGVSGDGFNGNSLYGLTAYSNGNITLTNVIADSNQNSDGAVLNNTYGTGSISVKNSSFNSNYYYGLLAYSNGDITLTNVIADSNQNRDGAVLNNTYGTGSIGVKNGSFNGNSLYGLTAYSNGDITLTNVIADSNQNGSGAVLNNTYGTGSISVNNSGISGDGFNGNYSNGLVARSNSDITLTNVIADSNQNSDGAVLNNTYGAGSVSVNSSNFNSNYYYGLLAYSNGNITLTNVIADSNQNRDGAVLNNSSGTGSTSVKNSSFNSNYYYGLLAYSNGNITLTNVIADSNQSYSGAYLKNNYSGDTGSISVDNSGVSGDGFNSNHLNGLLAYSNGDITLTNVIADSNGSNQNGDGAFLNNAYGTGSINVNNSSFNGNVGDGLGVISSGDITLADVTANGNGDDGVDLDNSSGTGSIKISSSTFGDTSILTGNGDTGVDAYSNGDITLVDVTANANQYAGAYLVNDYKGSAAGVMVSNSVFNGNSFGGVGAFSNGDINLNNVTSSGNVSGAGLFTSGTVTITCSRFISNSHDGFQFNAPTLNLNGVSFSGNGTDYLYTGSGSPSVFVNSVNCSHGHGGLPINIINVTGGESEALNCVAYSATELVLPDLDHILLPCPTTGNATLTGTTENNLPGKLDSKYTFVSAFDAEVTPSLITSMIVSFKIPAGQENANFTILYWDSANSKWVDIGGHKTADGFFQAQTNLTGTFMLATK